MAKLIYDTLKDADGKAFVENDKISPHTKYMYIINLIANSCSEGGGNSYRGPGIHVPLTIKRVDP